MKLQFDVKTQKRLGSQKVNDSKNECHTHLRGRGAVVVACDVARLNEATILRENAKAPTFSKNVVSLSDSGKVFSGYINQLHQTHRKP